MKVDKTRFASIFIAAGLIGWAGTGWAQKSGGTLRIQHMDTPPSASIHEESTVSVAVPFMAIYNNLVIFDQNAPKNSLDTIVPDLATSWETKDDGRKLVFKMRDGVKWHDGKPFSAADVACTFDLILTPDKLRRNPRSAWYTNVEKVTADSPSEVTFHLKQPQPSLLALLASGYTPIYPCHVPAADMRRKPVGTGPFKLAEFKMNEGIKLVKNPDYWKPGRPYLDAIEFSIIADRSTRMLSFIAGKFDMTFPADVTVPLLEEHQARRAPGAVHDARERRQHQPDHQPRGRALRRSEDPACHGADLDRESFIKILSEGEGQMGGALLPPPDGVWGLPPEKLKGLIGYGDVEKSREEARALMKEAGYGPDKRLKLKVSTRNIATFKDPAVILIDQLKQIWIDGELEIIDTSVYYNRVFKKDYVVALNLTGSAVDDPDVTLFEGYACGSLRNYNNYCNPEMTKLFEEQSRETDRKKRQELVWEIDRKLQEDVARPIISHGRIAGCWQPQVKNVTLHINSIYNNWRFEDVWIDR